MKKLKLLIFTFLSLIILPTLVNAASGNISISGTNTVVVKNKVTVTVTLSSSVPIGSWEMQLSYDKKYLQLTSTTAEGNGVKMANSSATGTKSKKYTFTFQALKTGSTKISIDMYDAYAYQDFSELSLSAGSKTINIITQEELEASYSKDNDLKELSVEGFEITPAFSKDNLNYKVVVPEGTTSINVIANPNDSKSSVTGAGTVNVTEGANTVNIVVRAENGSEKTYTLVVEVIDEHPINVTVDKENYTVIKIRENYTCPELFEDSEIEINDFKIPSCSNDKLGYTLVGLKKEDGTVESFIYQNGKYTKYNEVTGTSLKIVVLDYEGTLPGLSKATSMIGGKTHAALNYKDNSKFYVVYGMNVATGKKDFYLYDTVNNTLTLYDDAQVKDLINSNHLYLYIIVALAVVLILALICIIRLSKKSKKVNTEIPKENNILKEEPKKDVKDTKEKKKTKENKKEEVKEEIKEQPEDKNAITEIKDEEDDETETYYLFESDRKKHHKKKKNNI